MNTHYYTTSDGIQVGYSDEGEGAPLLLLSGLTRNAKDFNHLVPHLTGYRVIRPDYRGRGRSDHAPYQTYTVEIEARDQLELLDHLGLDQVAIIGTSRGGLIAMLLAAIAKHRLTGVCLNDIGPEIAASGRKYIMTYLGRRPPQKSYEDAAKVRAEHFIDFPNVPMSRWLEEVQNQFTLSDRGLEIMYDRKLRDAVGKGLKTTEQPDLWPLFDALDSLPLALLRGANSNLLSEECAQGMQRRRPDMLFANIPDRGHVPFLDEAESLDVIHQFLRMI
ncbi:alpha/beta fold hydrolase [Halocynthiibacter sp.]|uniref:alpha/beta fold hydrolase n=1 Tax=Halocynthiibacter sp. TaxID=1979210 RepID=UPI003C426E55